MITHIYIVVYCCLLLFVVVYCCLLLFVVVCCLLYTVMGGLRWKTNVLMSALLVPGVVFAIFFVLNLFLWGAKSSAAVPFTTLLALLCLWFGISLPLTFIGSFLGFRRAVSCLINSCMYMYSRTSQ